MSNWFNSAMRAMYGLDDWQWFYVLLALLVVGFVFMRGFSGPRP